MDRMLRTRTFWIIIVIGLVLGIFMAWLTSPDRGPIGLLPGQDTTWRASGKPGHMARGHGPQLPAL